jgi:membrane-bound ClpP family serine protease
MVQPLNNMLSEPAIKSIVVLLSVIGLIVGFFFKLISPEIFSGFVMTIVTSFYKENEIKRMSAQLDSKQAEIQSMKNSTTIVDLNGK